MNDKHDMSAVPGEGRTTVKRTSDREMMVTRIFDAPARLVFEAWTNPELFKRWWVPKPLGFPLRSCEMDVRIGGRYRLEFGKDAENTWAFFGTYIDVVPAARLVWTNEESENGAISTVTLVEEDGRTILTFSELYPAKDALEASLGGLDGAPEQFEQLDDLLVAMGAGRA